ncbi:hypothetical protein BKA67DRAFT_268832 [Truncatella angustata]|uniref:Uncharacterized protein n=1 Tax=Truncatella angustata TaxID=152316 RepID=A0A9P8UKV6_9PEZI|nr:uncharacterized protein BKA67DRAFT_268832 [Truncatella angustata]KAH6654041.1 hypothetical protein BKA67DRAFT_268832 [Truncatella angustata]
MVKERTHEEEYDPTCPDNSLSMTIRGQINRGHALDTWLGTKKPLGPTRDGDRTRHALLNMVREIYQKVGFRCAATPEQSPDTDYVQVDCSIWIGMRNSRMEPKWHYARRLADNGWYNFEKFPIPDYPLPTLPPTGDPLLSVPPKRFLVDVGDLDSVDSDLLRALAMRIMGTPDNERYKLRGRRLKRQAKKTLRSKKDAESHEKLGSIDSKTRLDTARRENVPSLQEAMKLLEGPV